MTRALRSLRWLVTRVAVFSVLLSGVTILGPTSKAPGHGVRQETQAIVLSLGTAHTVTTGLKAEMVALSWSGTAPATFSVRALDGTTWTEWLHLDSTAGETPDKHSDGQVRTSAG